MHMSAIPVSPSDAGVEGVGYNSYCADGALLDLHGALSGQSDSLSCFKYMRGEKSNFTIFSLRSLRHPEWSS